jgi:glycerophosphoryl diester phosphodiesterase
MTVAVSAHKGGSEDAPSGTLRAYESALRIGAEYVEFDIRRTRDGQFVVFHDPVVAVPPAAHALRERPVADHSAPPPGRRVNELTFDELCAAAGHRVPRVREVMDLIAGKALGHLDLKETGDEAEVIRLALKHLGPGNFVATTLADVSILRIKQHFPEVTTALSLGRDLRELNRLMRLPVRARELYPIGRMRACGADWLAVHRRLARANVLRLCGRLSVPAMVWTVNGDPHIRRFLADSRVTVLVTDRPRQALTLRT